MANIAQIIKIGNSKGIRIPNEYINALGTSNVVLELKNNSLVITPLVTKIAPRATWDKILSKMTIETETELNDFDITMGDGIDDL